MQNLGAVAACGLTILAGAALAGAVRAQAPPAQNADAIKKQDPVPPATSPRLTEQAGTTEPGAKVQATNPDPNAVFVNGVLAVVAQGERFDESPLIEIDGIHIVQDVFHTAARREIFQERGELGRIHRKNAAMRNRATQRGKENVRGARGSRV